MYNDIAYTVNIGGYDAPRTDNIPCFVSGEPIPDKKIQSRRYKIIPCFNFEFDRVMYMDANIYPLLPISTLLDKYLGGADIAVMQHPYRKCAYEEIEELKKFPDNNKEILNKQREDYVNNGFPANFGLWECGVIFRKNNVAVCDFMTRWYYNTIRYGHRDQASFAYTLWEYKHVIKINTIEGGNVRENKDFKYIKHL